MKNAGILFFIFSLTFGSIAANKIDSLENLLSNGELAPSQRIDAMNQLGREYLQSDPLLTEQYGREALEMALKINDKVGIANSYKTFGVLKYRTGKYDSALFYFSLAKDLFEKEGTQLDIYGIHNNIGATYVNLGQYYLGIEHILKSLQIAETELEEKYIISPLSNLGLVHDYLKQYDKAIEYYERAGMLAEKHGDHTVLRNVYNNMAVLFKEKGDYKSSLKFHRMALSAGIASGNKYGVGVTYNNLGALYKNMELYDSAKAYYTKSLSIKKELNDNDGLISLYINFGNLYQLDKSYDSAMRYFIMAKDLCSEVNSPERLISVFQNLSELYEETGDLAGALDYYKTYSALKDSLLDQDKSRQINELHTKYETGKKEAEIALLQSDAKLQEALLKRQRTSKNLIAIGSAFVLLLILTAFQRYRQLQRIKLIEAEKIKELDRIKSNFFANISHEFRTPLTLISGSLHKLMNKINSGHDGRLHAEYMIMQLNTKRLLQLINQLLDLARIDDGKTKLKAAQGDIITFIKRIVMSFASYAEQKEISLQFNNAPVNAPSSDIGIYMYFDPEKIEKIFYNLISNAVKFTPPGGRIDIDIFLREDRDNLEIKVINTGHGIPEEKLPYIFDRFYQADDNSTRQFEGSGIGLALAKELTLLHHGNIFVESGQNGLTVFTVMLPFGKKHLKTEEITENATLTLENIFEMDLVLRSVDTPNNKELSPEEFNEEELILIVEDHDELRQYIRENLSSEYKIIEAGNGKIGLEKAISYLPDLVISDVMMPEMDGFTLCKSLKQNQKTNHVPVILLTAKAAVEDKLEGLEYGADDYLLKPFNPDELQHRVRNLIRTRRQLREKFSQEMSLKPKSITVPSSQKVFLEKVMKAIEEHISDENFGVEELGREIAMSRAQTHRKIKALTNQSPSEFIRNFRLQRAAELIEQEAGNMAEIAYLVGFNSQAYFTRSFQEYFKCSPKEFRKKLKAQD